MEGLRILIVGSHIVGDGLNKFLNRMKDAAPDASVAQIAEPALDQIEPRATGGDEMNVEALNDAGSIV